MVTGEPRAIQPRPGQGGDADPGRQGSRPRLQEDELRRGRGQRRVEVRQGRQLKVPVLDEDGFRLLLEAGPDAVARGPLTSGSARTTSPLVASFTATTPARISRPPSSWTARGSSSSSSQANPTPATTSSSATNDASREPRRRLAAMPVGVGEPAAVTRPRTTSGTHQANDRPAYVVAAVAVSIGSTPTAPSRPRTTAPTTRPPAARASGGSPLLSSAEMTKYDAAPTIAAERPQHASGVQVGAGQQVQDQHEAEGGEPGADQGHRAGALAVAQPEPDRPRRPARCTRSAARGRPACGTPPRSSRTALRRPRATPYTAISPALRRSSVHRPRRANDAERRHDQRGEPDPDQHDRAGAPAGVEQAAGQRARHPERRRGDDRERQPARQPGAARPRRRRRRRRPRGVMSNSGHGS